MRSANWKITQSAKHSSYYRNPISPHTHTQRYNNRICRPDSELIRWPERNCTQAIHGSGIVQPRISYMIICEWTFMGHYTFAYSRSHIISISINVCVIIHIHTYLQQHNLLDKNFGFCLRRCQRKYAKNTRCTGIESSGSSDLERQRAMRKSMLGYVNKMSGVHCVEIV